MTRNTQAYLCHIRDAISQIREYTVDGEDAFFQDRKTQDAVIRNLEVIGEAVKNLPSEITLRHTDIPWRSIAGMRDRLIHHYFGVHLRLVWTTIENRLDPLGRAIQEEIVRSKP